MIKGVGLQCVQRWKDRKEKKQVSPRASRPDKSEARRKGREKVILKK